jgi:plastocyanin/mono/diheme cytochrome c family protein
VRRSFLLGAAVALAVEAAVAALVIGSGVLDVSATRSGPQDRILAYASTRSIAHHAREEKNPLASDPAAVRSGLQHYKAMCVDCHGGPGAVPEEFAAGLHPPAPDLSSAEVQSFTDGMLYETVARGIGSTGMPAFGKTHRPDEIWSLVAFVRHLPTLTAEERRELGRRAPGGAPEEAAGHAPHADRGGVGPASVAPAGPGSRVHPVSISNFKFDPPSLDVHVGDVIEWKNADFVAHTATADDHTFDTGRLDSGQARRVVAKKKGRFPYFCRYHLAMKGVVVVE